jgi:hypothetical protein
MMMKVKEDRDGAQSLQMALAALESLETGRFIELA